MFLFTCVFLCKGLFEVLCDALWGFSKKASVRKAGLLHRRLEKNLFEGLPLPENRTKALFVFVD